MSNVLSEVERARHFLSVLPLCQAMNMRIEDSEETIVSIPYQTALIGDPENGVVHGGVISVLLDTTLGALVSVHPENTKPTATIDLRIDYMRPAKPGERIYASGHVYQTTRNVAFVRGKAWESHPDDPIAMAAGAFTFAKGKPKI